MSGAEAIVDSSKEPVRVLLLARHPGLDVRVVHLVRDPRAVVASWTRGATSAHSANPGARMAAWSPRRALAQGLMDQTFASLLPLLGARVLPVRYEDFIRDAPHAIDRILRFAEVESRPQGLTRDSFVAAGVDHLVGGNPSKAASGVVPFNAPTPLHEEIPSARRRALLTLASLPLLLRFRYPLWPR